MITWRNWSGRQSATVPARVAPADEAGFVDAVATARANGWSVRAVGASHSHSRVAAPDGLLVDTDRWQGLEPADPGGSGDPDRPGDPDRSEQPDRSEHPDRPEKIVTIRAGSRIHQLGDPLWHRGLGLVNQGDIDRQSIAGAVSTGTHGTGPALRSFSDAVVGARLVLASGDLVECGPDVEPELFEVARQSLGAVGLVTALDLRVRPRYRLHEREWIASFDDVMPELDRLVAATRHFEFFWVPGRDLCRCKSLAELPEHPGGPGSAEPDQGRAGDEPTDATGPGEVEQVAKRERIGWSHQIFPSVRDDRHTEMEYGVPAERGPACFTELRELIGRRFPDLTWPLEYRTLAADDQLIGVASGRDTVTISVHQDVAIDDRPLFEACEEVFARHGGRPRWGKVHGLTGAELAEIHPGYRRWWSLRDRFDPDGVFVTGDLARLRP